MGEVGTGEPADQPLELGRPGVVWLEAEPVPARLTGAARSVARLSGGELLVGGRTRGQAALAVERWYRREARSRLERAVVIEGERLGLEPERVTVRNQRTRWGSCSSKGTLSFNWRLAVGPAHALRYVVIHELIHLRHLDHSRAFWSALGEAMPDWRRSAGWLRAHERALGLYRPLPPLSPSPASSPATASASSVSPSSAS